MENPNPRRSIADLPDKQLSEIFVRLPCYESVMTCKFVSKHWLSLLSNPKFVIEFVNHKRKKRQSFLPWTFLSLRRVKLINDDDNRTDESFIETHNKVFYSSPKFSMKFLPMRTFKIVATFKDLILCIDVSRRYYYICNPVTKRWVVLPPTPSPYPHRGWTCLICQDPFSNSNNIDDYMFRIVVVSFPTNYKTRPYGDKYPFITLKVIVFCSENSQWIDVDVRFPLHTLSNFCPSHARKSLFVQKGVVCKGMVCFCYDVYFGMFNPFEVTPMTAGGTTIEARFLPIPYYFSSSKLVQWGGRLISLLPEVFSPSYHKDKEGNLLVDYKAGISVRIRYQELDLNQVVDNNEVDVCWTMFRRNICIDKTGRSRSVFSGIRTINIHPTNKHLFFILTAANEVLLCDTRSSTLNTLGRFPDQGHFQSSEFTLDERYKHLKSNNHTLLELQYWPTPLPTIRPSDDSS